MPTLLVSGCAPPRPSIWRLSGEPITASSTWSRVGDVGGQVGGLEERAARGAAAHEQAGNRGLHGVRTRRIAIISILAVRARPSPPSAISNSYTDPAWVKAPSHAGNVLGRQPAHQCRQQPHRVLRQRRRTLVRRDRQAQHARPAPDRSAGERRVRPSAPTPPRRWR